MCSHNYYDCLGLHTTQTSLPYTKQRRNTLYRRHSIMSSTHYMYVSVGAYVCRITVLLCERCSLECQLCLWEVGRIWIYGTCTLMHVIDKMYPNTCAYILCRYMSWIKCTLIHVRIHCAYTCHGYYTLMSWIESGDSPSNDWSLHAHIIVMHAISNATDAPSTGICLLHFEL